ncbi:helix-turn-helix domain-containing protein [Govanella unica]|uniref:XRE family transcriptional regulator n=1 Tax=Govanella unica TaxID=2975056 RepID=A0A9X3Z661_9PROT|nr:XRE family transcriptional regulator [Govania unica]MDA5192678.1 XRE family transcriptional regulator [Govania unica]
MPKKDHSRSIGLALKARRRQLGMTLRQLATASGLSAPFLSQAERGLTTPSLVSLISLAKALDVDIHYFVEVPTGSGFVRRASNPEYIETAPNISYIRLTGSLLNQQMEGLIILVPPKLKLPTVQREGEGLYYILEGNVHFEVDDEKFILGPGDSVHFDQRHRYTMFTDDDVTARMLWVGTPPLFNQPKPRPEP